MPIKGKKKPARRGSRSRRVPAAAPRPTATGRRRDPWYRTLAGRVVAGITVLALLGLVVGLVVNSRSSGSAQAGRQDALESYTGQIRALLQKVAPPAGDLADLAGSSPSRIVKAVEENDGGWAESFEAAVTDAEAITPPAEVAPAHGLFVESIGLYAGAAQTYGLATELEGALQSDIFIRASDQRARAESVWTYAVGVVDAQLAEADAEPSGLGPPSAGGPARAPLPDAKENTAGNGANS